MVLLGHEFPGYTHKVDKRAWLLLFDAAKSFKEGITVQGAQLALPDHAFLAIDTPSPKELSGTSPRQTRWKP